MWYLGFVYFMYGFSYIIYMTFFAAYLIKEMGLSQAQAGGLWALVGGLSIFCGVLWGGISDLLGRKYGSALAYLTLAVAYTVFALVKSPAGFYLSAIIFGLTAWSIPTIMAATAGDYVGAKSGSCRPGVHHPLLRHRTGPGTYHRRITGRHHSIVSCSLFFWQAGSLWWERSRPFI